MRYLNSLRTRNIVKRWHLSFDSFYPFSKTVTFFKKKINFSSLFSELRLEGHDRSRLAKMMWVSNSRRKAPSGSEPSVAVSVVSGSWLGWHTLVMSVPSCWQSVRPSPELSSVDLTREVMRNHSLSSLKYCGSHGIHLGNLYTWILICWAIYVVQWENCTVTWLHHV